MPWPPHLLWSATLPLLLAALTGRGGGGAAEL
jgi:hypothetical protein